MKKFFHNHPTIVIGTLVIVFVGILIAFYSWAISDSVMEINQALAPAPAQSAGGFDLSTASMLDWRGLVSTSSPSSGASSAY